jgi:hypothetical protein
MSIRDEFEAEWEKQTETLKANFDAILRERLEAWCVSKNLIADMEISIDWVCDVSVNKLEMRKKPSNG